MLTSMLNETRAEIEEQYSRKKALQLTLIDDGTAQKLFASLDNWIAEQELADDIHLNRVKGETCMLRVQLAERGGSRVKGAYRFLGLPHLYLFLGILLIFI